MICSRPKLYARGTWRVRITIIRDLKLIKTLVPRIQTEKTKSLWGCRVTATDSSKAKNEARGFIANTLLFSVGNAKIVLCDGQVSVCHWNIQVCPQVCKFSTTSTLPWQKRQVTDLFVSVFLLSRSSRACKWSCGNQRVAFGAWLLVRLLQPLLLVEVTALYYSPLSFSSIRA